MAGKAGRRGNGEGSIRQRSDGRWEARYSWTDESGLHRGSMYGKTRAEVQSKLRNRQVALDRGYRHVRADGPETVGELCDLWMESRADSGRVAPNTYQAQEARIRARIKPAVGHIKLKRLRHIDLERVYERLFEQGYSASTVRDTHKLLHQAIRWAWRQEWIAEDVAMRVDPEILRNQGRHQSKARSLTMEELRAVFLALEGESDRALWVTALTSGLRFGELAGLRWDDVDLETGMLHVNRSMVRIKASAVRRFGLESGLTAFPPKTQGSVRQVLLPVIAGKALNELRASATSEWVFAMPDGGPIYQTHANRRWHAIQTKAGIPREKHVRMHDTRRTLATLEVPAGMSRITQARLGHAAGQMTMHYQDVLTQRPVVDHLDRIFDRLME